MNPAKSILSLFLLLGFSAFAQEKLDVKAEEAFKLRVMEVSKQTESLVSEFVQHKHLDALDHVIESKGKLVFLMPDNIRWEYTEPYNNLTVFRNGQLYNIREGKRNTIDLSSNKLFNSLNQLIADSITGNMFDEQRFEIEYFYFDTHYMVRFAPTDKRLKKIISVFEIKFNLNSFEVERIKLVEKNGDYTDIEFLNRKSNILIDPKYFEI